MITEIPANGSFSVTFNKPLRTDDMEGKLTVFQNGEEIPGTLRKTATTLVFSPKKPWESGKDYQVRIASLPAERGGRATEPIEQSLTIQKEKFLFLSLENRLMEGNPETGTMEPVTPGDIEIHSFSTGVDGRIVAVYQSKEEKGKNGILLGEKQGERYRLTMFPTVETPRYSQALLCNGSQALLLVSQGPMGNVNIEYFLLDWKDSLNKTSHQEWKVEDSAIYSEGDLVCSEDTPRVLYRKSSGAFVTNFLGEENEDLIGVFDMAVGFSPRDTTMLLQKSITGTSKEAAYRSELSLYQSDDTNTTLSAPNTLFREANFNGNGTAFSLSYVDGERYASRIETYTSDGKTWTKTETVFPPQGRRIIRHALSLDGNLLVLQVEPEDMITRVPTDTSKIVLWDSRKKQNLPFEWEGRDPQWEK